MEIQKLESDILVRAKKTAELTHDMMQWWFFTEDSLAQLWKRLPFE
jgi:hypothetical protein